MTEQKKNLINLLIDNLKLETQMLKSFYLDYKYVSTEHLFELLETFNFLLSNGKKIS
jgi:hypothetical protein